MALGKNLWRPFPCDAWDWLQDHEPLAQRLLLWMWTGPDSTASGLLRLREYSAAGALKSKPAAIRRALDELAKDGRLSIGATASGRHDVWLDRYLSSQTGIKSDHRQLIRREIEAFADGLPKAQAIEDWALWDAACRKAGDRLHSGSSQPEHTEQNRTEQNRTPSSSAIATEDTPAVAVVAQAVELELTAPAKPARTLTAGQQDAIFAKQMIRMFADRWNEVMAKHCAPVVAKSLYLKATTLAKNCAVIKHIDEETTPGADLSKLYEWAQARHDYHAGKTGRAWTFEAWHAADHLAQVFADYRQERLQAGGPKNFAFNVDRTLTQWRESVEYRQTREADHGA